MIFWILTVGGLASIGTDNEDFFARTLAEACLISGIADAIEELSRSLNEFLWSSSYLSTACAEFWEGVKRAQDRGKRE